MKLIKSTGEKRFTFEFKVCSEQLCRKENSRDQEDTLAGDGFVYGLDGGGFIGIYLSLNSLSFVQ